MRRLLPAALITGLVVVLVLLGTTSPGAPRPQPADAPAAEFSSGRAMELLRQLAREPRPIGSAAQSRARSLIVARLAELGLGPHVQTADVVSALHPRVAATVHNIVARLPGRDPSRAVLLVAHYDSVAVSAGAADDGAGVVTLLETARALRAGPRPRNDVIFLFTDGEERGLLGSRAFLRGDPWAYGVGVVLNFDDPGSSTPALMYETSAGNGRLVRQYLAAAPLPYTSSLLYEVSRRQPFVSDFRPLVKAGMPGMSFGALDGPGYMHTAYDSVDRHDEASLQHQGETALALARRFGDRDLWRLHSPDVVYFSTVGGLAVVYGRGWVAPFVGLAAALLAAAVAAAVRRRLLTLRGVLLGVVGSAVALGAALVVMAVAWTMYRTAYEQHVWSEAGIVISDYYRLGLVLLAAAVTVACYGLLLRRLSPWDLTVASLVWWLALAVVIALTVPGASYLLTWPLAGAALGLLGVVLLGEGAAPSGRGALLALAGAAPGVVLMSSATYLLLLSAGLKQVVTVVAVWLTAGLLVVPLAVVRRGFRRWLPVALAAAGLVVLFAVGSTVAFDAEHPHFTSVYYRVGTDGRPYWQTVDPIDSWTSQFLRGDTVRQPLGYSYFPQMGSQASLTAAAPAAGLRRPRLVVLSDTTAGDRRTVRLRLRSPRGAPVASLLVESVVGTLTARVDGLPLEGADTTILDGTTVRWAFDYYALPERGVVVTLRFAAGRRVLLRAVDFSYGLPTALAGTYAMRPGSMLPGRIGDGTLCETALELPASAAGAPASAAAH